MATTHASTQCSSSVRALGVAHYFSLKSAIITPTRYWVRTGTPEEGTKGEAGAPQDKCWCVLCKWYLLAELCGMEVLEGGVVDGDVD